MTESAIIHHAIQFGSELYLDSLLILFSFQSTFIHNFFWIIQLNFILIELVYLFSRSWRDDFKSTLVKVCLARESETIGALSLACLRPSLEKQDGFILCLVLCLSSSFCYYTCKPLCDFVALDIVHLYSSTTILFVITMNA